MSSPAPPSPEELLSELVGSVPLNAVCLPAAVRQASPRLLEVARRLAISVTHAPSGEEDVICVVASGPWDAGAHEIDAALSRSERDPFLLVLPTPADPASAVRMSTTWLHARPDLLARDFPRDEGAVLLGSLPRLLEAVALPGGWRTAAGANGDPGHVDDSLTGLWGRVEHDRETIAAIAARIDSDTGQLRSVQQALERATGEIARLRAGERRDVQRLQLELLEERAWVAEQARRIAASRSWRIGHGLTRLARRLAFRSDRGTNLPAMIARRMEQADHR